MILQTETLYNINGKIWYPYERLPIGSGAFWENHCVRPAWAICPPEGRQVFFTFRKEERAKRERYIKKFWTCWSFLQSLFCWSQPPGRPTQSERKLKRSISDPAGNFEIGTNKSRSPWSTCVYKYIRASGLCHQKIICQRWSAGLVCPAIGLPDGYSYRILCKSLWGRLGSEAIIRRDRATPWQLRVHSTFRNPGSCVDGSWERRCAG